MSEVTTTPPASAVAKPKVRVKAGSSRGYAGGQPVMTVPYAAAGNSSLIPHIVTLGPDDSPRYQRRMQAIARYQEANDAWTQNGVRVRCEITVGGQGPIPITRFPELEKLWKLASRQFDTAGVGSFARWLREDVYKNYVIDGEVFVRSRPRWQYDFQTDRFLFVPIQFQALTTDFVPVTHNVPYRDDILYNAGVAKVIDRPISYAMYPRHPLSRGGMLAANALLDVPASQVYHVFNPRTGSPRGEVPLAAMLIRSLKVARLEDTNLEREQVSNLLTFFLEQDGSNEAETEWPDEERISEMLSQIALAAGSLIRLPPGLKANLQAPQGTPGSFEPLVRFQLLAISAAMGVPLHELTGDWKDAPERAMRIAGEAIRRRAEVERDMLEHQLLNPMWYDFLDAVQIAGLWTPPEGMVDADLYDIEWQWPIIAAAAMTKEIAVVMDAVDRGFVPHGHVSQAYFGMRPDEVARRSAKDAARAVETGLQWPGLLWSPSTPTAVSIGEEAALEERRERLLVDEAEDEASILYPDEEEEVLLLLEDLTDDPPAE